MPRSVVLAILVLGAGIALAAQTQVSATPTFEGEYAWRLVPAEHPVIAAFDDGSSADVVSLDYRLSVRPLGGDSYQVVVDVGLRVTGPGEHEYGGWLAYWGTEFADIAERGDFSFVKRFDLTDHQRENAFIVRNDPAANATVVEFPGPFVVNKTIEVIVHADGTVTRVGANGWRGTWALWRPEGAADLKPWTLVTQGPIAPVRTVEIVPITRDDGTHAVGPIERPYPEATRWTLHASAWHAHDRMRSEAPHQEVVFGYVYAPNGLFIKSLSQMYADDLLVREMGLIYLRGADAGLEVDRERAAEAWAAAR